MLPQQNRGEQLRIDADQRLHSPALHLCLHTPGETRWPWHTRVLNVAITASPDWPASTVCMLICLVERLVCTLCVLSKPGLDQDDTFRQTISRDTHANAKQARQAFSAQPACSCRSAVVLTPRLKCSCNLTTRLQLHTGPRPVKIAR